MIVTLHLVTNKKDFWNFPQTNILYFVLKPLYKFFFTLRYFEKLNSATSK